MTLVRWTVAPVVLVALASGELHAQVGLAARLESGAPVSLGVPILMHRGRLLVEPILVFDRFTTRIEEDSVSGSAGPSVDQESRSTTLRLGVGAYLRRSGAVTVFGGPRVGWGRDSRWFEARFPSQAGVIRQEGSLSGLWYGALVGAEAAVGTRFAVGAEVHWYSETREGEIDEVNSFGGPTTTGTTRRSEHTAFTQAAVVTRWYPWRPLR